MSEIFCEICKNYKDTAMHQLGCNDGKGNNNMNETAGKDVPVGYNAKEFPPFAVTVDLNIFTIRDGALKVLLIERGDAPYAGHWALPGGFVEVDEDADSAAVRELAEETNIDVSRINDKRARFAGGDCDRVANDQELIHLEQLKTYSTPDRDPRMRVVSVAYVAFAADLPDPEAGDDAANARWWAVEDILGDDPEILLAFDHHEILTDALDRVRSKLEYTTLATQFVQEPFSLSDLRRVYSIVWGVEPSVTNFRRKVLSVPGFVEPIGEYTSGNAGPRALLYKRGSGTIIQPAYMRGTND